MKSLKDMFYSLLAMIFVVALVLAFFQLTGTDVVNVLRTKSGQIDVLVDRCLADMNSCSQNVDTWINSPTGLDTTTSEDTSNTTTTDSSNTQQTTENPVGNSNNQLDNPTISSGTVMTGVDTATITKDDAVNKLNSLTVVSEYTQVPYKRTEWKHWSNVEGSSCWNVREEALYRQAVPGTVILLDKNKKETTDKNSACSIKSGEWKDPYSDTVITDPTKTDLDHTSALAATARAGGQSWDSATKEKFANDLDHLVVTTQKQNRTKSDKTPSEWLPEKQEAHCDYAKVYVNILNKYGLQVTQADKDVLANALGTCAS